MEEDEVKRYKLIVEQNEDNTYDLRVVNNEKMGNSALSYFNIKENELNRTISYINKEFKL